MVTNREVIDRYVQALAPGGARPGLDTLDSLRHREFVEDWPQSGERIVGARAMRSIDEQHPNRPASGEVERVVGSEDHFVTSPAMTVVQVAGAGDVYTVVFDARYRGRLRLARHHARDAPRRLGLAGTTYFAPRLERPAWREPWTSPMPARKAAR